MSKQVEIIKGLVEGIIRSKYSDTQDLNFSDMEEKEAAEYAEVNKKYSQFQEELFKEIPKEYHKLINQYFDTYFELMCVEKKYMFNRGVKAGLKDLGYVRNVLGEGTVII